jgi:UDP-N-acetylmuramoyl-tripeptide--D-alanyl-D-alanine ligase
MLELGEHADAEHERIGRLAGESGIDVVIAVGAGGRPMAMGARAAGVDQIVEVGDADGAVVAVREQARAGDAVLVKASRAVGLERVAEALTEAAGS